MKLGKLQFRLRTLILAITIVALFCGIFTHWMTRADRQRDQLGRLQEDGFNVGYKVSPNELRGKIADKIGIDMVASPKELFCNSPKDQPIVMADVVKMKSVEHLTFNLSGVTDRDLELLDQMPNLKHLNLSSTGISNAGIANLADLRLISLHIRKLAITDDCIDSLSAIKTLKWISVSTGTFSDSALERLRSKLPDCEIHPEN